MGQIRADVHLASYAIAESEGENISYVKYMKGLAGYHLQQAAEKMIKIQIYHSDAQLNYAKIYRHDLQELMMYAESLEIPLTVPDYIRKNALYISGWEAKGRYDVRVVVRIDTL